MSQLPETLSETGNDTAAGKPHVKFPAQSANGNLREALIDLYAPIEQELSEAETLLNNELHSPHATVDEIVRHGVRLGGKRLRPALLLLAGQATGKLGESHRILAAVVEMIHLATLVHDDVLDEATIRRHVDTVNARWNNETSVLLGDFLFSHAFYLASTTGSTYACKTIGRSTNIVCEGEIRQTNSAGNLETSEADYLSMIDAKTAELCACCCQLGAHFAGADPSHVQALSDFGRNLGIAFQIIDDLLDLEGQEEKTGKSLGSDLAKCKLTLPLIHARDNGQQDELAQLLASKNGQAERSLEDQIDLGPSLSYARQRAQEFANRSLDSLASIPDSTAKESLTAMAQFTLARCG